MNDMKKVSSALDKRICSCQKDWLIACKHRSVESMAINSSIVYLLLEIKHEIGLITDKEYYIAITHFENWKKFSSFQVSAERE